MMKNMITARDMNEADQLREDAHFAKLAAVEARKAAKHFIPANMHSAIGVLQQAKGVTFYAFINGQYLEGSVEALTGKLVRA